MVQYYRKLALINEVKGFTAIDDYASKYEPKQREELDSEQIIEFIDHCRDDGEYGCLTAAQYVYGTRRGETFSLIPDLKNGTSTSINTPKGGKKWN